jgi:aminopeptidase N
MDLYFERHDGQAVTCDDFVQAMQDASGVDLSQFRLWYSQAGTPMLRARGEYDPQVRRYTLTVEQQPTATPGQPRKLPYHIPFAVGLVDPMGADIALRLEGESEPRGTTRVLDLRGPVEVFRFEDVPAAPVPSLLRSFSAPVTLEYAYSENELALLAAHDSDPVNRWAAAQKSFARAILSLATAARTRRAMRVPRSLVRIVSQLLADEHSDPALVALALTPPDIGYVAALESEIDADSVVAARDAITRGLARALRAEFEARVRALPPAPSYAPTEAQIGPRRLRNVCLRYLGWLDDAPARALAVAQFDRADNMTDTIGALSALRDSEGAERDALYGRFESTWRDEPLVLDKWFALEATSQRPDTLARMKMLIGHPRFNARNPNRVRSLVGAFALRNFARFHAADGGGYEFVADQVLALDPANPQLASTLAGAYNLWKRFSEPRRSAMERALHRIARAPVLSPDVSEVVSRTLDD